MNFSVPIETDENKGADFPVLRPIVQQTTDWKFRRGRKFNFKIFRKEINTVDDQLKKNYFVFFT